MRPESSIHHRAVIRCLSSLGGGRDREKNSGLNLTPVSPLPGSMEKPLGVYRVEIPRPGKLSTGYMLLSEPHSLPHPQFPRLRIDGSFSRWRCRIWEALSGIYSKLGEKLAQESAVSPHSSVILQGVYTFEVYRLFAHTHPKNSCTHMHM